MVDSLFSCPREDTMDRLNCFFFFLASRMKMKQTKEIFFVFVIFLAPPLDGMLKM